MQKLYYSISEASKIVGEPQYVLRYWEKEFPILKPKKNRAGNRIYSEKDIEILVAIKSLLREQKLSTKGALEELFRMFDKPTKPQQKKSAISQIKKDRLNIQEQTLFNENANFKIILKDIRNTLKSLLEIVKNL
ncbi:MAG: MerR family transcriptional regulator [Ignavibacteria bacterium]|nr:MerR family transcriptional regulator [Ignavibacteria bacterium]